MNGQSHSIHNAQSEAELDLIAHNLEKNRCTLCKKTLPCAAFERPGGVFRRSTFHRSTFSCSTFSRSTFQRTTPWGTCNECTLKRSARQTLAGRTPAPAPEHQTPQLPLPQIQTPAGEQHHQSSPPNVELPVHTPQLPVSQTKEPEGEQHHHSSPPNEELPVQTPQLPLPPTQESGGEQHHHSSPPNDELPVQTTSLENIAPPTLVTTPTILYSSQGYRWQDFKVFQFDSSNLTADLHRSLTRYTLAIRLLEISQHWHPRGSQKRDQRFDIIREMNTLLSLMDSGRINPWPIFRAWFEWYRAERDPNLRNDSKTGMAVFKAARVASEQLEGLAKGEMVSAVKELTGLLPSEPPLEHEIKNQEAILAQLKADVVEECKQSGCLGLKDIFTTEDIKKARFSEAWKADGAWNA